MSKNGGLSLTSSTVTITTAVDEWCGASTLAAMTVRLMNGVASRSRAPTSSKSPWGRSLKAPPPSVYDTIENPVSVLVPMSSSATDKRRMGLTGTRFSSAFTSYTFDR